LNSPLPAFQENGDLPPGIHQASLQEVMLRFGVSTRRRKVVSERLERIFRVAVTTGHVARFIVFGSFITAKPDPNDVDIFLLMENSFDESVLTGEARLLFDHGSADTFFGASVFWLRRLAALGGEEEAIGYWQTKRDGGMRGIVEIRGETK
jgi:hypothetical protein